MCLVIVCCRRLVRLYFLLLFSPSLSCSFLFRHLISVGIEIVWCRILMFYITSLYICTSTTVRQCMFIFIEWLTAQKVERIERESICVWEKEGERRGAGGGCEEVVREEAERNRLKAWNLKQYWTSIRINWSIWLQCHVVNKQLINLCVSARSIVHVQFTMNVFVLCRLFIHHTHIRTACATA